MATSGRSEDNESAGQIARAAARLFARRGFEATSTREIVEEAGVAKPTLYYHFGSKEGLARALLIDPLARLLDRSREIAGEGSEPSLMMERFLEAHFDYCREDPDRARFFFAAAFAPPEGPTGSLMGCRREDLRGVTEVVLRRCVEFGLVPEREFEAFETMFRGMLLISIIDFLYHGNPLGEDRAGLLVATLLRAFAGRGDGGRGGRA